MSQKSKFRVHILFEELVKEHLFILFILQDENGRNIKTFEALPVPPVGSTIQLDDNSVFEVERLSFTPNLASCTVTGKVTYIQSI